jgi:hypothetical protein
MIVQPRRSSAKIAPRGCRNSAGQSDEIRATKWDVPLRGRQAESQPPVDGVLPENQPGASHPHR